MSTKRDTISRQDAIEGLWDIQRGLQMIDASDEADLTIHGVQMSLHKIEQLQPVRTDYDKIIAEIKQCISETREHGKHHAKFVQDNGELYISGLEMALSIIEENR